MPFFMLFYFIIVSSFYTSNKSKKNSPKSFCHISAAAEKQL